MPSVDDKIVKMEFDNAAFERKLAQTVLSIAGLDKALKLAEGTKGLTNVAAAAKKVDLAPVAASASKVSASFVAMSTIAITALATITHAALNSASQIVSALSFKPLLDGFKEYQLNIGSIQTILANTRADNTGLKEVNAALDQLNDFSDKTIYNFGQMTKNIGTFTAAGVDLETSVQSIKGISTLAALSGSSAEQAATAMYQLSQAVSTGTLRLMDWNSVVNAGMGGEVFQKALFETGVAMKTITDAPVGTTFEEWKTKGNSFRDSLQDGWLTGEVLTNTLKGFTGELTDAQLLSIGYTQQQVDEIQKMGAVAVEAATKIRTLSQLMQTVKETIGSGWSESFRTVFGDFEEASVLFTNINNGITGFVKTNAEARNALLAGWKELGGRDVLINALGDAFKALTEIIRPIKEAFRDIFPATTSQRLFEITQRFAEFTAGLRPSEATIENIKRIFTGLFSALDIGVEIIKGVVGFIKELVIQVTGLGEGNISEFTADIADFFTKLREGLDKGEGIKKFFDALKDSIPDVITMIRDFKDAFLGLFDGFDFGKSEAAEAAVGRIQERFEGLAKLPELFSDLVDGFSDFIDGLAKILSDAGEMLGGWFDEAADQIAEAIGPGDFDAILDALNTSLLGGIALIIAKFLKGGLKLDVGDGLLENVSQSFQELTDVLKAMQTQIKVNTLLKIATAIAVMTASVVALSLVDSAKLAPAMATMAAGFAELLAVFVVIGTMNSGIFDAASFAAIATGMIALSAAMVVMAGAVALFGTMETETLSKGLGAITAALTVLTTVAIVMSKNAGSFVLASVSLGLMSAALIILAGAVALFGNMEMETIGKGLGAIAAGLVIIGLAMGLMPLNMPISAAGLILVGVALNIIAGAVAIFGTMEWETIGRGLVGIAGALIVIGVAMGLMPLTLPITAAGLLIVSVALTVLAKAMEAFGGMSWSEIGKGLTVLAVSLIILAVAMHAMQGALAGAFAMVVVTAAVAILADVLVRLAEVPFGDLLKGIAGIAIALTVLGVAGLLLTPVIPTLLNLGLAMLLLGAGFALVGLGAVQIATALEKVAKAGPEAGEAIVATMVAIGKALPKLFEGFAQGIIDFLLVFVDALPVIVDAIRELVGAILDLFIELLPKIAETLIELGKAILDAIRALLPDLIEVGIELLIALLTGIRDNIYQITDLVLEIIVKILQAIEENIEFVTAAGVSVLVAFVDGLSDNEQRITEAVGKLVETFVTSMTNLADRFVTAGTDAVIKFASGITNNANRVVTSVTGLITSFINTVGANAGRVVTAGVSAVISFVAGIQQNLNRLIDAGVDTILAFLRGVAQSAIRLAVGAFNVIITFLNALATVIRQKDNELRAAGLNVVGAIIDGMTGGLASKAKSVADAAVNVARKAMEAVNNFLGINSPAKKGIVVGASIDEGMALGLDKGRLAVSSAVSLADRANEAINNAITTAMDLVEDSPEFNPTVTPVLDLTRLRNGARSISSLVGDGSTLSPNVSIQQANAIATTALPDDTNSSGGSSGNGVGVQFNQTINAPSQLSTGEIYRQTRNQITLAKEELDVA